MQIQKIKSIRKKGLIPVLRKAISGLMSPFFLTKRLYLIEHDLSMEIPEAPLPEGYEARKLSGKELDLLFDLVDRRRFKKYKERIQDGMSCFAVLKDGDVVSFCWVSEVPVIDDILKFEIPVSEEEAYFFDSFTRPEERSSGLFVSLLIEGLHRSRMQGKKKVVAIHCREDLVKVYPKYRENGLAPRTVKVVANRRILRWRTVKWAAYGEKGGTIPGIPPLPAANESE